MKQFIFIHSYLLFLLLAILSGCAPVSDSEVTHDFGGVQTLKVGISPNAPPLVFKKEGRIQGLEIDFARQLGEFLGRKVKFVELSWDKQITALEKGDIDVIMSGMTITGKRSYRVAFSKPYMRSGQILLVRMSQSNKFSSGIYSLMGNQPAIGVVENTTGDYLITETINRPDLTRYKTSQAAVNALVNEKIDAVVHDAPILCYYAAMNGDSLSPILQMATEEYLAWAVKKSDSVLLNELNQFLDIQESNGDLKRTIQHWIPYM
ncbi:MAG: ABC transporter substrate-binding protein [Desulfopila sp.]|jgi:polar amino acid transport system substrate-binding protein|nr:ABC transporter substrate-binding protein [Desulfopila sp.]